MNTASVLTTNDMAVDEQARHGITRIASERFEVNGFRYDRLSDAVAEAKRGGALRPQS